MDAAWTALGRHDNDKARSQREELTRDPVKACWGVIEWLPSRLSRRWYSPGDPAAGVRRNEGGRKMERTGMALGPIEV
jgi:hypothetical protein